MEVESETGSDVGAPDREEGEGDGEEELLLRTVPYIHNEYILTFISEHSTSSAARMILDLPLCKTKCEKKMTGALSSLKKYRARLIKNQHTDGGKYARFLSAEFVFPPPTENPRSVQTSRQIDR